MTEGASLIGVMGLGITLILVIATLVVASRAWRQAKRTFDALDERFLRSETELKQARQASLEAQREVQRLQEERPEKLEWELRRVTEELGQWQQAHSEIQQELGQRKQEWLHKSEQQEQQRSRLKQESQNLMEELERWRWRYVDIKQEVEQLRQERSEERQKIEQLTQLRERLLEELREISTR